MHPRFVASLEGLQPSLRAAVAEELNRPDFEGWLSAAQAERLTNAGGCDEDQLCLALLPLAAACALAPISHFNVGAVARGVSGNLYFGANMEFTGAPLQQTVHAEQSAITHAWLRGESQLRGITVNYTPCGHCRQFMNELNSGVDLLIHLPDRPSAPLAHYLPAAFGPRDLAIGVLLMDSIDHQFTILAATSAADAGSAISDNHDPLVLQLLQAANQSHAPYSHAHSAVALSTSDGRIFAGRYAENAAFNPSLPPLQSALILMNMAGVACDDVQRAALAEHKTAPITQWEATRATLQTLGCETLERYWLT